MGKRYEPTGKNDDKSARRRALRHGKFAETLATIWLMLNGYRILARNYRCRGGEIDIVARKRDVIAFVEVKARQTVNQSVDAVGYETRQRVSSAADHFVARTGSFGDCTLRFDIIAVLPFRWPVHLQDAF